MTGTVIIGAGGHGREVLDIVRAQGEEPLGFLVEQEFRDDSTTIHELPVLGGLDWLSEHPDVKVICALGAPELRLRLTQIARGHGVTFGTAIHPSVQQSHWVSVGAGVVVGPGSILTNEIVIEDHVHVNVGSTVSHDVRLGEFVTLSPGVHLAGGVTLGEGTFLGVGAVVLPRVRIGAWSTVGAGAVVIGDVAPGSVVVGVPAKVIKTRAPGWHLVT